MRVRPNNEQSRQQLSDVVQETLSGTCHASANTQKIFYHSLKTEPTAYAIKNSSAPIYVVEMTDTQVDVRSTTASATFTIILFK